MSYTFDLYQPGRSWLHRLDPRVKLWMVVLITLLTFAARSWLAELGLLLLVWGTLRSARIPRRALLWLWQQIRLLVVFILVLQTLFVPSGAVLVALGPLALTRGGLEGAALLALRALVMVYATGILLFATPQRDLILALTTLGLPYTWGLTLSLTLRFIPALFSLAEAVREAQAARGWVAQGRWRQRLRDYQPVLIAVIIGTLRMSDQVALALAARGLRSDAPRTVWRPLTMRSADWAMLALSTLLAGAAWWLFR